MDLIEPESAYARRSSLTPLKVPAPRRPLGDGFWTKAVLDVLRQNGDEPMRFTSLVNEVAKLGNYSRRADYDRKRVELFKLVSKLIRTARLDRVERKHVAIPRTDARCQAYLAAITAPLDLPPPQV